MLLDVKLFLREDEIITFKCEDIAKELAVISHNGPVECLPMSILGKEEDDSSETFAICHDKHLPRAGLMRYFCY